MRISAKVNMEGYESAYRCSARLSAWDANINKGLLWGRTSEHTRKNGDNIRRDASAPGQLSRLQTTFSFTKNKRWRPQSAYLALNQAVATWDISVFFLQDCASRDNNIRAVDTGLVLGHDGGGEEDGGEDSRDESLHIDCND